MKITVRQFKAMASACEVTIADATEGEAASKAQHAIDEVLRIEKKFSRYLKDSVVSRINAAAGMGWVTCDEETLHLLHYADTLYRTSGGLFDITSGILRRAWNFTTPRIPDPHDLNPLLDKIGWSRVDLKNGNIRLPKVGMEIDFGGFGKEYAADRAAQTLVEAGISHGYVNLGGDIRVVGPKPDGSAWSFGIQHPREHQLIATIPMAGGALATSGDYERFFELAGRRYCHILNPKTGQPAAHWRSVSVLAPLAIAAGSCTTIAMLKEKDGLAFLNETGFPYFAIDHQGKTFRNTSNSTPSQPDSP
jgi:thiamine biosynthesis lipoprotein